MLAHNAHGAYAVPRSSIHRPAARRVLNGEVWENETVELLRGCDPEADIVHAGTFFGDFLPALARSRAPGAIVWAFEPSAENYRCAAITVLLNDLHNVVLTHAALGEASGTAQLAISSEDGLALGGGSHLLARPAGRRVTEEVPVVTIDGTVPPERNVGVVQLDVEGHELPALAGASRTIERCRPLLVLESPPDVSWFASTFPQCGYTIGAKVCDNTTVLPAP